MGELESGALVLVVDALAATGQAMSTAPPPAKKAAPKSSPKAAPRAKRKRDGGARSHEEVAAQLCSSAAGSNTSASRAMRKYFKSQVEERQEEKLAILRVAAARGEFGYEI